MFKKFLIIITSLIISINAWGQFDSDSRAPQLILTAKDATHLLKLVNENQWFQQFSQTNTYRGLLLRISPVMNQLGSEYKDNWKGKLIEYVFQKLMRGRAVSLGYVAQRHLISPMGMIIHDLSPTEVSVLNKLIASFPSNGLDNDIVPIEIQRQSFATKVTSSCFFMARDPKLIESLSPYCNVSGSLKSDARLRVHIDEALPGAWPSIKKIAKLKRAVDLYFSWDDKKARFLPKNALVRTTGQEPVLRQSFGGEQNLLKALPSDSLLAVTASIADYGGLNVKSVTNWIASPSDSKQSKQITYVLMPGRNKTMSAILVPAKDPTPEDMKTLGELFNETSYVEVKFAKHCGSYIALSNEQAAIDKLKEACSANGVSLTAAEKVHRQNFAGSTQSAALFVNLGAYFASAMEMGRESLAVSEKSNLFISDKDLLAELPAYSFSGILKNNLINMKASY